MDWVVIIKPLEDDFDVVTASTTTIESSLHPIEEHISSALAKQSEFRRQTSPYEWNLFEECVMSSILSPEKWEAMCALNAERIRAMKRMEDSSSKKDLEFLLYKLDNKYPVDIAKAYYDNVICTQLTVKRFFACWKYLFILTGTADLVEDTYDFRDIKYYWSAFWEGSYFEYDTITIDNCYNSRLRNKTQRYTYPYLANISSKEVINFHYDIYSKSKNVPSTKNPENHIKRDVISCEVNIAEAGHKVKDDIIRYFKLCQFTGTKIWETVPFTQWYNYD